MANVLTGNPWVVDTAAATDLMASETIRIKSIRWVGATTAGHAAEVQDGGGEIIWSSLASGANYVESDLIENIHTHWVGLKVPTLASGKLYIEYA